MSILFVTGSEDKFREAQLVVSNLEQVKLDLPELQEIDPHKIIGEKLKVAFAEVKQEVVVEDTSLYFESLKGLPGPLIKWFLKTVGNEGLVKMAEAFGETKAVAKTIIGYTKDGMNFEFFEGDVEGKVVVPRGDQGFGWDPIFEIAAEGRTFAEMTTEEKTNYSMRRMAFQKLKDFLG